MTTNETLPLAPLFPAAMRAETNLPLKANYVDWLGKNVAISNLPLWMCQQRHDIGGSEGRPDVAKDEYGVKLENIIHLVRQDAIVLTIVNDEGKAVLRYVDLHVGRLLFNDPDLQPSESNGAAAMSLATDLITPALEHESQARYIFPGLGKHGVQERHIVWKSMEFMMVLDGVRLADIHKLGHPWIDLAASKKGLQIGGSDRFCAIRFEALKTELYRRINGPRCYLESVRVSLTLQGDLLSTILGWHGSANCDSAIGQRRIAFVEVCQSFLRLLKGRYIPLPEAADGESDIARLARLVVMARRITWVGGPNLMAISREIYAESKPRMAELRKAIMAERDRLTVVPVAELFTPEVLSSRSRWEPRDFDWPIHPLIAAAYNSTGESGAQ